VVPDVTGATGGAAFPLNPAADVCLPFIVNDGAFRGRLVRLTAAATQILGAHNDPEPVSILLAQAMAAAVALAAGLKYTGVFSLQIQGKGALHTLVTDVTSGGDLRGCATFDTDELKAAMDAGKADFLHLTSPGGHLAFTVDQGPDTERYQGIVELEGTSLADAIHHYFRQSEQLDSAIKIAVGKAPGGGWTAAALIIQRMPEEGGERHLSGEHLEDAWRTAVILLSSLKDSELLDLTIAPERLLMRLYATVGVVPTTRRAVAAKCRCSRERSERILASFPVEEIRSYAEDGNVHMTCEFCRTDYVFPEAELDEIATRNRSEG